MNIQNLSGEQRPQDVDARGLNGDLGSAGERALSMTPMGSPASGGTLTRTQYLAVPEQSAASTRANPLAMIWRRRGIVLAVVAACVLGAWVKYILTPAVYRSEARLFVQTSGLKAGVDGSRPNSSGNLHAQAELIKSTAVMAMILASPELDGMRTFEENRYSTLKQNLDASVGKENDIITVSFDSPYPKEAKKVLEEVIKAYSGFHTKEKRARFAELEKWRGRTQTELEKKQKELVEFKRANGALSLSGEKGNIVMHKLERLEQALTDAHVEKVNARSALDSVKGMMDKPERVKQLVEAVRAAGGGGGGQASTEEQSLRAQLFAVENHMEELRRRYLPAHPAIQSAQQAAASLKARIGDMDRNIAETYVMRLQQDLAKAEGREKELQRAYDDQKTAAMDLSAKLAQADVLEAEVKRLTASVDKADQQMIEASASDNVGVPNIQVFDDPNLPGRPIKPVRNVMLFQGLILGLLLGCAAALVRDWTDQGLRSSEEITQTVGTQILGTVPHIPNAANPLATGRKVDLEPASDVAEMYRTIRTAVFFGTPERESRTILVTSPSPGEGKSTFASNLAIAMAQTGKRVLLIDADFRRPIQHRVFECRTGVGLSSVLTGGEAVDGAIQQTGIPGLDIVTAGPVPSNPAEILNSQLFTEVLEELSVRYDHVVIDSPPVLMFADARILSAIASVTILVLRAESSTRKGAMQARHALDAVGAHLLGVVVNDVPRWRERSGDYDGSGGGGYRRRYVPDYEVEPVAGRTMGVMPPEAFLDLRKK